MEIDPRLAGRLGAGADSAEEQFKLLVDSVVDYAIMLLDPAGAVISWNPGAERIKGYAAHEIIGQSFALFYPEEEREKGAAQRALERAAREGHFRQEGWRQRKDGSRFWAEATLSALRDAQGRLRGFAKVTRDMTAHLREREHRALLAEAQKLAALGCWEWDPASGAVTWSEELYRIFGVDPRVFRPSFESYLDLVHPEDRQASGTTVARALIDNRGFTHEERIVRPDGTVRHLRSQGEVVRGAHGRAVKIVGACLDVTAQKEAEGALRALGRRLVEAEEAERRRIARDLHDLVGQNLSALNINLDLALAALAPEAPAQLRGRLEDALVLVEGTLQAIEGTLADLRPPLLEEYGLGAALAWYAARYAQRSGVEVRVEVPERLEREPRREAAMALFRIAQEALANVARHARVKQARLGLAQESGALELSVSDQGCGFDPEGAALRGRWGMRTMRERAEAAGGRLEVRSAPGGGTLVRATVPL